jgi:hypothetical protein
MNHVLRSLMYGDIKQHNYIRKTFEASDHTNFDMMLLVEDTIYEKMDSKQDFFYFMKLVPHIFIDEIKEADYYSYSYSLNHNSKVSSNECQTNNGYDSKHKTTTCP